MHKREEIFLDRHLGKNKTYEYQPRWFRFKNGAKYMPDFYCFEDNTYIEVVGSKQAFYRGVPKYKLMRKEYSEIKLEFIAIDCFKSAKDSAYFENMIFNHKYKPKRRNYIKLDKRITIYIDEDRYKEIKQIADKEDRSVSNMIDNIFKQFIESYNSGKIALITNRCH